MPTVLIVDDDEMSRRLVADRLSHAGYVVLQADDGRAALQTIKTGAPDLILCDLSMPVMDGYELLDTFRAQFPAFANIPFIFISARTDPENMIDGAERGADDYIAKPIDFDRLLLSIKTRLGQAERMQERKDKEFVRLYKSLMTGSDAMEHPATVAGAGDDGLAEGRDRFLTFAFCAADILIEIDRDGLIVFAMGATQRLLGAEADDLQGRSFSSLVCDADRIMVEEVVHALGERNRLSGIPIRLSGARGTLIATRLNGSCFDARHGNLYLTLAVAAPADSGGDGVARSTSGMIALPSDFAATAQQRIAVAGDDGDDYKLTLLGVDYGSRHDQEVLDEIIARVGPFLRAASVAGDTAGQFGDDRFGIVHESSVDAEDIRARVLQIIEDAAGPDDGTSVIARSVLLNDQPIDQKEFARVLAFVVNKFARDGAKDLELQSLGDGLRAMVDDVVKRIMKLRRSFERRRFALHFQPIVELKTRQLHHYEALLRLPDGSSPMSTIAFAEETGIIGELDLAICVEAMERLRREAAAGRAPSVAINLSVESLESDCFVEALLKVLANYSAIRQYVMFELTESAAIKDFERLGKVTNKLRNAGHVICLDDFGAGETNFHYLRALKFDMLKIDGSYVKGLASDQQSHHFVRAITGLCGDVGARTVAEAVETEEQASAVRNLGVTFGQGYLFGRPAPELDYRGTASQSVIYTDDGAPRIAS